MSLESWKKEFYPTRAADVKTLDEALTHTERKWEGLRPENLERHGLRKHMTASTIRMSTKSVFPPT